MNLTPSAAADGSLQAAFARARVVPVITVDTAADALALGRALVGGGLFVLEVTLRTPGALDAVRALRAELPQALVGVGTALEPAHVRAAAAAGAQFAVSPGLTARLAAAADGVMALLPGAATASEVMAARDRGFQFLKLFPCKPAGGAALLRSLGPVFPDVRFCPTGGVSGADAADYLALDNVACVGGTWMTPQDRLAARDWAAIERLAGAAARIGQTRPALGAADRGA